MRLARHLFLLGSLAAAAPLSGADRALVVGVERYANPAVPPTEGSERDARELARFLGTRMGFPADSIRLLVNSEATASRIEQEFRNWLIAGSGPGDRVFFSYSGHGSRVPRSDGSGTYHNTLAPFDVDPETGSNQVLDTTVRHLVNQLAGRRAVLLFDSCHSGSIARSVSPSGADARRFSGRYLPTPGELATFRAFAPRSSGKAGFVVTDTATTRSSGTKGTSRGMFLTTSMTGAASGIIAIAAAADHQVAYPFQTDEGTVMGALTWSFLTAARDGKLPFGRIKAAIPSAIAQLQASGRLQGGQQPQFDIRTTDALALENQALFGTWQTAAMAALQNPASSARLSLRMGPRPEGQPYREGDVFHFDLDSSMAGYVSLFVFSEGRRASCLLPNAVDDRPFVPAGRTRFPRKGEEFVVECEPSPCGTDIAVAIVSERPLQIGERQDYSWEEVFDRLRLKELESFLGSAAATAKGADRQIPAPVRWQAASSVFESRRK